MIDSEVKIENRLIEMISCPPPAIPQRRAPPQHPPHLIFSFLFTAKNVRLHSCLILLSVGFTPAGGGRAPNGVN